MPQKGRHDRWEPLRKSELMRNVFSLCVPWIMTHCAVIVLYSYVHDMVLLADEAIWENVAQFPGSVEQDSER